MSLLFDKKDLPRSRKRIKRMAVMNAGMDNWLHLRCSHCGYEKKGYLQNTTITEIKRGIPCPECNEDVVFNDVNKQALEQGGE